MIFFKTVKIVTKIVIFFGNKYLFTFNVNYNHFFKFIITETEFLIFILFYLLLLKENMQNNKKELKTDLIDRKILQL